MKLNIYMDGTLAYSQPSELATVERELAGSLTNLVQRCPAGSRVVITADYGTVVYLLGLNNRSHG